MRVKLIIVSCFKNVFKEKKAETDKSMGFKKKLFIKNKKRFLVFLV